MAQRNYDRLDPMLFRSFMAVADTLNFTRASEVAAMTQSGVSQQIAKLETQLGASLFTRTNKSVLLTTPGKKLVAYIERYADEMDAVCAEILTSEQNLSGAVTYGMPSSCLLAPHLGFMLKKRLDYPEIDLRIQIRTNPEIVTHIHEGHLDFGFVTENVASTGLKMIPFCQEEFVIATPVGLKLRAGSLEELTEFAFVGYPGMETYFEAWQHHYYPKVRKRWAESLYLAGRVESIHGAITLAAGGVGCIAIPSHCVDAAVKSNQLVLHYPDKKPNRPLLNMIHIASLEARKTTRRAQQVVDWFLAMHPEIKR